jgi:hypothetical protein
MRAVTNFAILTIELATIAAAAWLAFASPIAFGALTALLILLVGFTLERARLNHDVPFYVDRHDARAHWRRVIFAVVAAGEALARALLAGAVAILTFAGKDTHRILLLVVLFGTTVFFGSSVLRRLSRSFAVHPARWGYFRLAVPLGVMFSLGIQILVGIGLIKLSSLSEIARTIVFELPERPDLAQVTEFMFNIKQTLDALVYAFLERITEPAYATVIGVVVSINVMAGLVISIYAVVVAEIVRKLENSWLAQDTPKPSDPHSSK